MFPLASPDGPGKSVWNLVCDVVCEDLCQPNDLPVVLIEQKSILVQAFAVLQALHRCRDQWCSRTDTSKFSNSSAVLLLHILLQRQLSCLNISRLNSHTSNDEGVFTVQLVSLVSNGKKQTKRGRV